MRTMKVQSWLPLSLTVTVLCLGTAGWTQDNGGSKPAPSSDAPQVGQPSDGGVNWKGVGLGAGAIASNVLYVPAKLVYGILGGIAGGAGYALTGGNKQVADSIWRSSLGGDYVLTPDMMTGEKPIYFVGPSEAGPAQTGPPNGTPPSNGAATSERAPLSASRSGSGTQPPAHSIDSGAGPVESSSVISPAPYTGASNPGSSSRVYSPPPAYKGSTLTDTSIE